MDPNLAVLAKLYADHLNAHQGRSPKDEAQFKDFIRQNGAARLGGAVPDTLDALFLSTRDNQPLIFFYGADPRLQSGVVGYEQTAVDGKRTVGYRHGTTELIEEAKFVALVPATGDR